MTVNDDSSSVRKEADLTFLWAYTSICLKEMTGITEISIRITRLWTEIQTRDPLNTNPKYGSQYRHVFQHNEEECDLVGSSNNMSKHDSRTLN